VIAAGPLRYGRPWDFSPEDVPATVRLWHGEQDPKVPSPPPASWRPVCRIARPASGLAAT